MTRNLKLMIFFFVQRVGRRWFQVMDGHRTPLWGLRRGFKSRILYLTRCGFSAHEFRDTVPIKVCHGAQLCSRCMYVQPVKCLIVIHQSNVRYSIVRVKHPISPRPRDVLRVIL